jgi:hypothetical protein
MAGGDLILSEKTVLALANVYKDGLRHAASVSAALEANTAAVRALHDDVKELQGDVEGRRAELRLVRARITALECAVQSDITAPAFDDPDESIDDEQTVTDTDVEAVRLELKILRWSWFTATLWPAVVRWGPWILAATGLGGGGFATWNASHRATINAPHHAVDEAEDPPNAEESRDPKSVE